LKVIWKISKGIISLIANSKMKRVNFRINWK